MKIYVTATLRNFFGRNPFIELEGENIRAIMSLLTDEYPDGKKVLFEDNDVFMSIKGRGNSTWTLADKKP